MRRAVGLLRWTSWCLLVTFTWQQVAQAEGPTLSACFAENSKPAPLVSVSELAQALPDQSHPALIQTTTDFLQDNHALSAATHAPTREALEQTQPAYPERLDFQDALEELRPEYAAAVILKSLKAEDLKALANLEFEVGIIVLHGEIVLFTSGSEDEVGVLPAVKALTDKAAFISHTHPGAHSAEGPSAQDLDEAVESPGLEYVITHQGVYAYNRAGVLNDGAPYSYDWYLAQLQKALSSPPLRGRMDWDVRTAVGSASSPNDSTAEARKDLNAFIAEQDRYNEAEEERITLRRGGTLTYTNGLSSSSVSTLSGSPLPSIASGSTGATTLSSNTSQLLLGYSVLGAADQSGLTISFDNAGTAAVETQNLNSLGHLIFGLKGPNPSVKLEIIDINNNKDTWTLTGVSNSTERFWKLPVTSIAGTLDRTRLKQLNFVVAYPNTTSAARTGTLALRVKGVNTNAPAKPVVTSVIPPVVNTTTFVFSGTKETNSAIMINNVQVVAANSSTTWSATVNLASEGSNAFSITAKNALGKISAVTNVTIKRDTLPPSGTLNLNPAGPYVSSQAVTLNLTSSESGLTNKGKMSFSTDGAVWSTPENYAATKAFTLPAGDGLKTVSVKFYDAAGNASPVYSKQIALDTLPPAGTITVNGGAQFINQTAVTLNLTATDAGAGLDKMSFSTNGTVWSTPEVYAAAKTWTFAAGDGNKIVHVKFLDKSGKWSSVVSAAVVLDTVVPTGWLMINNGSAYTASTSADVMISAADTGGSGIDQIRFSGDNGQTWDAWQNYTENKTVAMPAGDGTKTVQCQVRDKAGNVKVLMNSIVLDTTPVTGSIKINHDDVYTNQAQVTLNLTAEDALSGLGQMRFSTNEGQVWTDWENYQTTKTLGLPTGDGLKAVLWQIWDKAWNLSSFRDEIFLDTHAPAVAVVLNPNSAYTNSRNISAALNTSDGEWILSPLINTVFMFPLPASGVDQMSFAIDSANPQDFGAWESVSAAKDLTLPNLEGVHTVNVRVRDRAGNISAVSSKAITLDTIAPTGSLSVNGGAVSTASRDVVLDLQAADALSGVDQIRISVDGGASWGSWEAFAEKRNVTLPEGPGAKEIKYEIRDKAGNVKTLSVATLLVNPLPQIVFTSPAASSSEAYSLTYTADGRSYSESWQLAPGENQLLIHPTIPGLATILAQFKVTCQPLIFPMHDVYMPTGNQLPNGVTEDDLVSITTQAGLVLKYYQDKMMRIEKPGEYRMFDLVFNANGELTGGAISYTHGDSALFKQGKPVYFMSALGDTTWYDTNGRATKNLTNDGKTTRFAYRLNAQNEITGALIQDENAAGLYENGKPVWIVRKDLSEIRYVNGMLSEYRDAAGNQYRYTHTELKNGADLAGYKSELTDAVRPGYPPVSAAMILSQPTAYPSLFSLIQNDLALSMEYNKAGMMTRFVSGKNEELSLADQLPVSLRDAAGRLKVFETAQSAQENWAQMTVTQNGFSQTYGQTGAVVNIRLMDGTTFLMDQSRLGKIQLQDGSTLDAVQWNGENLTDFVRTSADGTVETYQAGHIVSKKEPNGNRTTFFFDTAAGEDKPNYLTTPDGRTYHTLELENAAGLTDRITELVKVELPDGGRVEFKDGKPVRFVESREIQLLAADVPSLPAGQAFIPLYETAALTFRSLTIDAAGAILSGEVLFADGTQYFVADSRLTKQITPDGKIIEIGTVTAAPLPPLSPVAPVGSNEQELVYRDELIQKQLDYFLSGAGIDSKTGFPLDHYDALTGTQSAYSQATLVGMWAEILSAIALGHYVTPKMSKNQALQKLEQILFNLITVQEQAGWNGMFSFFGIAEETRPLLDAQGRPTGQTETAIVYKRQFGDIGLGDNLNLAVSLNSVIGAIGLINDPALNAARERILGHAYHIVWKMEPGWDKYYDPAAGRFRMTYQFNQDGTGQFAGHMDRVFNEFRPGLIWLASFKPAYRSAIEKLDVAIRTYETSSSKTIDNAVPFDGGAFQMFWPLLHVDETKYAEFDVALKNFLYTQADYVAGKGIPGLISAGADPGKGYNGKMGVPAAAETDDPLETRVGSIYGTASAFLLAPHYTLQFLKNIETAFPGVRSGIGFADSIRLEDVSTVDPIMGKVTVSQQPVYAQQYYGVDQAGFLLSLMGTSRSYFDNYLNWHGLKGGFDQIYQSLVFGLAPAASSNPAAPDFGNPVRLYAGENLDGYSHALVKRPAFIATLSDTALGEGQIFDYLTPGGQFHHAEIEFQNRKMGFQEYILMPGRSEIARSLTAALRYDLFNEGDSRGAFYTPEHGYSNGLLMTDPEIGEVHRLDYDFREARYPVGLWNKFDGGLDLTKYDYLSVPVKLGEGAKEGMRIKFEFKGMGEVFITPALTNKWQYVQVPIVKPAAALNELAVVVQTPDGLPDSGALLIGPLSAVKTRTSNQLDWALLSGYSDAELRNLLKQKALEQPAGGGKVMAEQKLENFTVDADGKLIEGVLKRADGGLQYFHKGRLSKWVFRDGRTVLFEKGLATFILDLSRGRLQESRYYYDQDFRGNVKSFVLQDNDRKRIYGADGRLAQMIDGGRSVNFKDGQVDTLVLPEGTLSNLVFGDDLSLLSAHVKTLSGAEFDIGQGGEQMIQRPGGIKVFYSGNRVMAVETPQNGRTAFTYSINALGQLMGVDTTFDEEITDPATGQKTMTRRILSLFEYLQRPERSAEAAEILREPPRSILPGAGIGGFSVGAIAGGEQTFGSAGSYPDGAKAGYQFRYNSASGALMGMYVDHKNNPVTLADYDFIQMTLRQDASMTWNQDLQLTLKSPGLATLYTFQADNAPGQYQTVAFALAGKAGSEGQTTVELARREAAGVGKTGMIYFKDIAYVAVKKLSGPLWESLLAITSEDIRHLKKESLTLAAVGAEIAKGQPLVYSQLAAMQDLPTWVTYEQKTANASAQLTNFKRFDGSEVTLEKTGDSKIILSDGTVNEYSAPNQTAGGQAGQIAVSGLNDCGTSSECSVAPSGNLDYNYGALRKVTQTDGHELHFSYEFDTDGNEVTLIHDSVTGDIRRFKAGKLIQATASDKRETAYRYEQGRLAAAEIMYKNRVLDSTRYTYTPEETQVIDERGTTWYYDVNGNLIKHLTREGYLYRYMDVSHELDGGRTFAAGDYKNDMLANANLQAVNLAGFEAADGSRLLFDAERENYGEVQLAGGTQGVNLLLDENQKIKSGQIQFSDGLILEIENYTPRRGRLQNGGLFDLMLPQAYSYELLQGTHGVYAGVRLKINGNFFTYDGRGHLIKFETEDGRTDTLTHTLDAQGKPVRYSAAKKQQISFRGIPYPKPMELKVEKTAADQKILRLMDSNQEVISKEGSGFIVAVYKAATNQWDATTGTFASPADRFSLKNFLAGIKAGDSVSAVVSDSAFSAAGEDIFALFETLGAGGVRQAAAQTGANAWAFYGMKGLAPAEGLQKTATGSELISFSTVTETAAQIDVPAASQTLFEEQPLHIETPQTVTDAFSLFLQSYEKLKMSADMQKTAVYDEQGDLVFSRRMDGVTGYYQWGKVRETFTAKGELLYVHEYACKENLCKSGEDMKLTAIRLVKARADFEAESKRLRETIEQGKFDALYKIATQDEEARLRIHEIVTDGLRAIDNQISSLESQRFQDVKVCHRTWYGAKKCNHYTVEVPGVQGLISDARAQRSNLLAAQETELAKIPGGVAAKKQEIEDATKAKIEEITAKEKEFLHELLLNEVEPVLADYYRRILGRDASTAEINAWVEAAKASEKINIAQLEAALAGSPEKQTRENQKTAIIQSVRSFLNNYLSAAPALKTTLLESLKLKASDIIDLDQTDAEKILTYLETRSLHFGQSAFSSLKAMLDFRGTFVSLETLGRETILIDILTGVLNPFSDGELVLSLFALSRAAAIHSADFSAVKYAFNDLSAILSEAKQSQESCHSRESGNPCPPENSNVIAHIGEDHYVVITRMTDSEVFYRETGKGAEGEEVRLSREAFMKVWAREDGQGYLLVDSSQVLAAKKITEAEAQKIRGAFFPLIWLLYASIILSIASAIASTFSPTLGRILGIAAMVTGVISIVANIGNLILTGLKAAYGFVSQAAQQGVLNVIKSGLVGIGKILMAPVHFVGRFITEGFTFLKDSFQTGLTKLGSGLRDLKNFLIKPQGNIFDINHNVESQFFTGRQIAARQLLGVAIGAAGPKALEGLGVNPVIANLATAFVSGGFAGTGGAMSGFLKSGLQHLVMQGVSEIGLKIGLPPPITNALSLVAGTSLKAWFDPALTLKKAVVDIVPTLTGQLALSGMELVGRSLGVSPMLSKLIGLPFASGLAGLAGGLANNLKGTDLFGVIKQTIAQGTAGGLISIGANLALDKLGVPAQAREFMDGFLKTSGIGQGLTEKLSEGISKFGRAVSGASGSVVSFGAKVLQQTGQFTADAFKKTIGAFTALFDRQTQEAIHDDLAGIRQGSVSVDGAVWTWRSGDQRVVYNSVTGTAENGFGERGLARITGLGQDETGNIFYEKLDSTNVDTNGISFSQRYKQGRLQAYEYVSDMSMLKAKAAEGSWINEDGRFDEGDLEIGTRKFDISFPDEPVPPEARFTPGFSIDFKISEGEIVKASIETRPGSSGSAAAENRLDKDLYVLANGINNPENTGAPAYMGHLQMDLADQSRLSDNPVDPFKDIVVAPMYTLDNFFSKALVQLFGETKAREILQQFKDSLDLIQTQQQGGTGLVWDVKRAIEKFTQDYGIDELARGMVGVGYSGGFVPLVDALSSEEYNPKSFVALGAATFAVGAKLARALVTVIKSFENLLTLRDDTTRALVQAAVGILGTVLKGIPTLVTTAIDLTLDQLNSWYEATDQAALDAKIETFYKDLRLLIQPSLGFNWGKLAATHADLVVNIWGTRDPIARKNIFGGYLSEIGGYSVQDREHPLFNIEIEGADHFDYIKGITDYNDIQDPAERAKAIAKNERISGFVTRMILAANSATNFQEHVDDLVEKGFAEKIGINHYKLSVV